QNLLAILPDYMVPSFFVALDEMPLTLNGKVDKKALPTPEGGLLTGEYVAPANQTESTLVKIWSQLLKIDPDTLSTSANFFESGGHSLLSVRLVGEVRSQLNVELAIKDVFDNADLLALAGTIDGAVNTALNGGIRSQVVPIERHSNQLPTSFAQQRLWFIDQMDGGSVQYNMPIAVVVKGVFDEAAAELAFVRIIERHEPLRTVFVENESDGSALQHIRDSFEFKLLITDLTDLSADAQQQTVLKAAKLDAGLAFNLRDDLMVRSTFIRLSADEGTLLFNMHHIASDGWSMGLLVNEFWSQYQAIVSGKANPFASLEVQYADYAQWQRNWLAGDAVESQLSYWDNQLADLPQVHSLPLDRARPKIQSFKGDRVSISASVELQSELKQLALDKKITLFMLLQGTFSLLLSRHSNSTDITLGVPMANRLQKELAPMIGFFVNTLVLRCDCSGNPLLTDYWQAIKTTNLDAQANQDVPFEHLVERLNPQRSTAYSPLFQVMFTMDTFETIMPELADLNLSPLVNASDSVSSRFELMLSVAESATGLSFTFEYNTDIFDGDTIERLGRHYVSLLSGIVANSLGRIGELPMLSQDEREYLLHTVNKTGADYAKDCIHQLFERQAQQNPDNIALVFEHQQLSYQQLNEKANRLAHYLIEQGVAPGTLVGIAVERSMSMVIGILAILKAGGAYVPFDLNYPQSRLDHMVLDSGIRLLLSQKGLSVSFEAEQLTTIWLDDETSVYAYAATNPDVAQLAKSPAYVIYTSGSTGLPKGVVQSHQTLTNLVSYCAEHNNQNLPKTTLAFTSISFDVSVQELATSWFTGSLLVMISQPDKDNLFALPELLQSKAIERVFMPPSVLQFVAEQLQQQSMVLNHLSEVIVAGDALLVTPAIEHFLAQHPECCLWNHYGPTETHVVTTARIDNRLDISRPPIGKAVANTRLYVLDDNQNLTPYGNVGQLYVSGVGVALEYLNQSELTSERFITSALDGSRLYATGDLVRYIENGELDYIGRADQQVKIRGFRIELGEIEHQLAQLPQVKASVVLAREDQLGMTQLVAYLASDFDEVVSIAQTHLKATLPQHMIPTFFVVLDELPLTNNGKIDRKALPAPDSSTLSGEYVAPKTPTEIELARIWAELLKLERDKISASGNFFDLGGHSILVMQLLNHI
ncbi:MAG: amino acid adenylation domain-containing protein, partial [Algicola sp.]|nr:amino acid adenylation domain-containing protein [Algicola sp.]